MLYLRKLLTVSFVLTMWILSGCGLKPAVEKGEEGEMFSETDRLDLAMKQEFLMTRDPALGYVPKDRLTAALAYTKQLSASRALRIDAITWQERGPNNVGGRVRALFVDSRDATGNTVFAAGVSGGIWKATNFKGTPTWTPMSESMGSLAVCALAQDPSSPNTMYAGTGEGWFNNNAVRGNGIWKSTDGGSTWNKLAATDSTASNSSHNFDYIQDLVVNSGGILFATGRPSRYCNTGGVMRSADGGATWTRAVGHVVTGATVCDSAYDYLGADLEIAKNGDIYATTGFNNKGEINDLGRIWRSAATNGSNIGTAGTWTDITPAGTWQRIELACAPNNAAVLYALLEGTGTSIGAIKKTTDFGATWTDLPLPNWCNQGSNSTDFTNNQAWFDLIAAVDPNNSNTIVIGGIDLFKSTDGGATWNQITQWARNCSSLPVVHADQHNIIFLPGSSTEFIAANDGGLYFTNDAGATFATYTQPNLNGANQTTYSSKNTGFNVTQLYGCDIHPTATNYFLAGAQDNGSFKFTNPGVNTVVEASVGGDGGICHIDQTDGNIQILSYVYNNYYYSRNNGATFNRIEFNNGGEFINASDLDDVKKFVYSGSGPNTYGLLNLSGSGTPTFSTVNLTALGGRTVSAVKVDPTVATGGTVWIAGFDSTFTNRPNIIKLTNANTTTPTAAVNVVLSAAPAGSFISSIDVDRNNASHLLITLSNYGITSVYESTNSGSTWASIEGNLPDIPVRWGLIVPSNASVNGVTGGGFLLATEVGVWYATGSSGASTTWAPQNTGLPNVRTDMLRYRPSDNLLAAATHGRGLFTSTITSIATGVPTVDNTRSFIKYGSAGRERLFVKIGNLATTKMQVRIFDAAGRLVYSNDTGYADQNINIGALSSGSYILKIYGNRNEQYTQQFIK